MDTPARHIYTGNGNQKVFPIPTKIIGDDYIRIEIDGVYQSDRSKWDIVNNNVVFLTAPINTANIDIQVATSEEALSALGSTTNMDIVAGAIGSINDIATEVVPNITEILQADNNAVIATTKASEANISASGASTSATSASNSASTATTKASEASSSASIATTKANEASTSATSASNSASTATTKASEALASANNAVSSASIATTKASEATTSASEALASKNLAEKWASELEDVIVAEGKYSAYHWAIKASELVTNGVIDDTTASVIKTYSSHKINALLDLKANLLNPSFTNHIGIGGVAVSNWGSTLKVVEGEGGVFFGTNGTAALSGSNAYYDGANWRYKANGTAGLQLVNQGTHTFRIAVSGNAGDIIDWITVGSLDVNGFSSSNIYNKTEADNLLANKTDKAIDTLTDKATPVNADLLYLGDSASSFSLKKLSWVNIKAALKTYLDTLYVALTGDQSIAGIKTFISSPLAPTPTAGDNSTKIATTAYVDRKMVRGTAINSTSGTSIDFTGIPSWVKEITIMFDGVSTNGTSVPQIQLGKSAGIEGTGYYESTSGLSSGAGTNSLSSGFAISNSPSLSTYLFYGSLTLSNLSGNLWTVSGNLSAGSGVLMALGGSKLLAGTLDRIRLTTVNGTDTFDAGSINIIYKG